MRELPRVEVLVGHSGGEGVTQLASCWNKRALQLRHPRLQKDQMKSLWKFRCHVGRNFKKNKNLCNIYFFRALSKS